MAFLRRYWPGFLITFAFLIIGLCIYQDYGASTDELGQRDIGLANYKYVFEGDTSFYSYPDKDHGPGFELPLIILEKKMGLTDYRDIILERHLVSHLFFVLCMLSGYFLAYKLFKNQFIACATLIMLFLNPRLYAHSFFNSKDMTSLSALLLTLSVAYWAFERKRWWQYLITGVVCGYAISIRLMNIMICLPLLFFIVIDVTTSLKDKLLLKKYVIGLLTLLAGLALTLYICWPALWGDPVKNLVACFESLARFRWQGHVLFDGILCDASDLPWSFIPSWFFVTVPEVWLFLGFAGIVFIMAGFLRDPLSFFANNDKRQMLLYIYCFVVPVIAVIILNSILYDDWRHLYFIYPPFILLAAYGMHELFQTKLKTVYKVLWFVQLLYVGYFIIRYHPHEYIYFNHALSHKKDNLMQKYELDYWGLSNIKGLEWILEHTGDDSIYVNNLHANKLNWMMLTADRRIRFILTDDESKMEYYVENYRLYPLKFPEERADYQIKVSNSPILRVTKLK